MPQQRITLSMEEKIVAETKAAAAAEGATTSAYVARVLTGLSKSPTALAKKKAPK